MVKHHRQKLFFTLSFFTFLLLVGVLFLLNRKKPTQESVLSSQNRQEKELLKILPYGKIINTAYRGTSLTIFALEVEASSSVSLIPNFGKKLFPETIARDNECAMAVNGGFYKGDYSPLGLFYTNTKTLGKEAKSTIANGFFWQDTSGNRIVSDIPPASLGHLDFVLQSGPIMTVSGKKLLLRDDSRSRRSLLGVDNENRLYLLSVIAAESTYLGPYLADIPPIFAQEEVQKDLSLVKLLNLDGGSASFFYSTDGQDTFYLSPLAPVGSVICVKKG